MGPGKEKRGGGRLFSVIQPLGRLVETELQAKLGAPEIKLGWAELRASDLQARARSFKNMVEGGNCRSGRLRLYRGFYSRRTNRDARGLRHDPASWSASGEPSYTRSHSEVGIAGGVPSLKSTVRVERALDAARSRA